MALVILPYMYIPDPTRGKPVFNGSIYIGQPDEDPEIYPKGATLVQEDGLTVTAEYPIEINSGGVPTYNGSPVAIDVIGNYSIKILNSNGSQVYYFANAGDSDSFTATDLRAIMFDLGLTYDDIGTLIVVAESDVALDDAEWILNTSTGEVWKLPDNIPAGSAVVSISDNQLTTNNGTFQLLPKPNDINQEVSPLNNDYNGYMDPPHQERLPSGAGYPGNSGGGEVTYALDDEISFGIYSGAASNDVSSDDDGWIFTESIYKLFTFTVEQLALIDIDEVPIYLKDESGNEYFVNNSTTGVTVSKPDTTTLKVLIDSDIFTTLGITKLWQFFVTERVGRAVELSPDAMIEFLYSGIIRQRDWYNVTTSRTLGVVYTNTRVYEIFVSLEAIGVSSGTDIRGIVTIGSEAFDMVIRGSDPVSQTVLPVPPGETYQFSVNRSAGSFTYKVREFY